MAFSTSNGIFRHVYLLVIQLFLTPFQGWLSEMEPLSNRAS
jgi:hypothetical protein